MNTFDSLGISPALLKALPTLGIETPTAIQEQAIPILRQEDKDFIGLAQTGTGKTAAFGLPLIDLIEPNDKFTQAIVLAPTRELGQQIAKQLLDFSKFMPAIHTEVVYGGVDIKKQIRALQKPTHIIIGTPGRTLDLIKRKVIKLESIRYVVLDEADEMLNMGFKEDIDKILSYTPDHRKTWLFSATMPKEIRQIVKQYMKEPAEVKVSTGNETNTNIDHQYTIVSRSTPKIDVLRTIIEGTPKMRGIIFCRTKMETKRLAEKLEKAGYSAEALHGDMSQSQRDNAMRKFKAHKLQVMVATDVAARGIDVDDLTHVIHYQLPDDISYYTHRSGRTARAGKKGVSLAFVSKNELGKAVRQLERKLDIKFTEAEMPNLEEIEAKNLLQWAIDLVNVQSSEKKVDTFAEVREKLNTLSKDELIDKLITKEVKNRKIGEPSEPMGRSDRSDDRPKREKRERRESTSKPGNVRFFINIGLIDDVTKKVLTEFIAEESGIKKTDVDNVWMDQKHSFFEVDKKFSSKVSSSFKDLDVNGRPLRVNRDDGKKSDKTKKRKRKSF